MRRCCHVVSCPYCWPEPAHRRPTRCRAKHYVNAVPAGESRRGMRTARCG
ncbi:hypothetical protein BSLA_01f1882 [Burkholderia stabilis]|nr:hypothetical protein BSLA_01f1882 [Burkholderia stabilis]